MTVKGLRPELRPEEDSDGGGFAFNSVVTSSAG